jgi:hypothetical protein
MILPPLPYVRLVAILGAVGVVFAGGIKLESWRDAGTLGAEKLAHQADIAKLQSDWAANLEAERKVADQAQADLAAERNTNEIARENAQNAYVHTVTQLRASADRNLADAQRVREQLAAAIAAGRSASGNGPVQQAAAGPVCGGASGDAACGFLARAIDILKRCAIVADEQHAAIIEAVSAWPK